MISMLETLLTFIGAILLLALVSQSLIEVVKTAIPIQAMTRMGSARALLEEAARSHGLTTADGSAIYQAVADRLRGLGQSGWVGVRLDRLGADDLADLVKSIRPQAVPGLQTCADPQGRLGDVADRAGKWFDMAMAPVSDRYARRMRVTSFVAAAVVVIGLNVDAISLMQRARTDPDFSAGVTARVHTVDSLLAQSDSLAALVNESLAAGDSAAAPATAGGVDAVRAQLDSATARLEAIAAGSAALFDAGAPRRLGDLDWWLGILLSIFLVSLGAPFWHDLLGSVLGLKQRLQVPAAPGAAPAGGTASQDSGASAGGDAAGVDKP